MILSVEVIGRPVQLGVPWIESPILIVSIGVWATHWKRPMRPLVFCVGTPEKCPPHVVAFPDERSLIMATINHILRVDPDIITSWEVEHGFCYLAARAAHLTPSIDVVSYLDRAPATEPRNPYLAKAVRPSVDSDSDERRE